jgi:O-antigen ligase
VYIFDAFSVFRLQSSTRSIVTENLQYLQIGSSVSIAMLVVFNQYFNSPSRLGSVFLATVLGFFGIVLLVLGGRGPLIAAILPMVLSMVLIMRKSKLRKERRRKIQKLGILFLLVIIIMAGALVSTDSFATLNRMAIIFSGDIGNSANVRIELYMAAFRIWMAKPLIGAGIGGFPVDGGYGDIRLYPHNLFLEVLAEFGSLGFLLLIAILFIVVWKRGHEIRKPVTLLFILLFTNTFIRAQLSGDLSDNRMLFFAIGLCVAGSRKDLRLINDNEVMRR